MLKDKKILFFTVKCITFYLLMLMMSSYLNFDKKYANHFRGFCKYWFQSFEQKGDVRFHKLKSEKLDTHIELGNKDMMRKARYQGKTEVKKMWVKVSSHRIGFLPMIIFLALLFATPLSWFSKLKAAIAGLIGIYIFIYFQVWVVIAYNFDKYDWLNVINLSLFYENAITFFHNRILISTSTTLLIPVFIWVLVSFTRKSYEDALG